LADALRRVFGTVKMLPNDLNTGVDVMIPIFCDFYQFSAKKLAFFSKTNVMITIFAKTGFVLSQKRQYFR
jgi:hypothetical protein